MSAQPIETPALTKRICPPNEVRWCAGCGDYSVLAQVQKVMPQLGIPRENFAVISGIGCSSRFPYYMNTYGFHTIHGRAPAIATGLKTARPDLSVWVVTGDGDALSIGGNHFIHALRRNIDINVLLFNNQIYGLTKGQYSPTSEVGKVTKSSPMGSIDTPFHPLALALGARAGFVARTIDSDPKHLTAMLKRAADYKGTSFIEVYQNCKIFNGGAFAVFSDRKAKADTTMVLEHGKPLLFGQSKEMGIVIEDLEPKVVKVEDVGLDAIVVHNEAGSMAYHAMLADLYPPNPVPLGVVRCIERETYNEQVDAQLELAKDIKGEGSLEGLLSSGDTWMVE